MERESYENPAIAKILNDNFGSIKVDREERPDIDQVYMAFVQATTGNDLYSRPEVSNGPRASQL